MPKSARKILVALSSSPSVLNQKDIVNKTGLSIRSVKSSLRILVELDLVDELIDFTDMRNKAYKLGGESK